MYMLREKNPRCIHKKKKADVIASAGAGPVTCVYTYYILYVHNTYYIYIHINAYILTPRVEGSALNFFGIAHNGCAHPLSENPS
jgi:hypothetical protein